MLRRSTPGHGPFDGQTWDKTFVPHPGAARKHHLGLAKKPKTKYFHATMVINYYFFFKLKKASSSKHPLIMSPIFPDDRSSQKNLA